MGESLVNTRRRINTIKSTEKITKAMKLVASVKYQRWRKAYDANTEYYNGMRSTVTRALCSLYAEDSEGTNIKLPPAMKDYQSHKNLFVIVTSSLGLCGAYNYNLFKEIDPLIQKEDTLLIIGSKGLSHYNSFPNEKNLDYVALADKLTYSAVRRLRHYLIRQYTAEKYDNVYLCYTHYKNSLTFLPTKQILLPFSAENEGIEITPEVGYPPVYDPNIEEVLNTIIPHYIDASMYRKILESLVSEQASRRNAMETATDNADEIAQQLQIQYNKARQNSITQEITEVVAGANAGKKKDVE